MKVAVMGGGSSYTPELINGFLERIDTFPMTELWLLDICPERLDVVGGFAQRMVAAKGAPFTVLLTTDRRAGRRGCQLRHHAAARRLDGGTPARTNTLAAATV